MFKILTFLYSVTTGIGVEKVRGVYNVPPLKRASYLEEISSSKKKPGVLAKINYVLSFKFLLPKKTQKLYFKQVIKDEFISPWSNMHEFCKTCVDSPSPPNKGIEDLIAQQRALLDLVEKRKVIKASEAIQMSLLAYEMVKETI